LQYAAQKNRFLLTNGLKTEDIKCYKSYKKGCISLFRRYHVSRRTGLLVNKSSDHRLSHLNPDPNLQNDGSNQNYFNSITSSEGKDSCNFGIPSDCRNWRGRRSLREKQLPAATLEMTAAPIPAAAAVNINSCHVYSNPNYPHSSLDVCGASQQIEIGGHPFFLTSGSVAETSLTNFSRSPVQSPVHSKGQSQGEVIFLKGHFWEEGLSHFQVLSVWWIFNQAIVEKDFLQFQTFAIKSAARFWAINNFL